jgi:ribosomal protein S18 acetylase RimI-like enzyme
MPDAQPFDSPSPVEIRSARLEDLPKIVLLESRVWRELAASEEEMRKRFALFPQGLQVAVIDSNILGFCGSLLTDTDASQARLTESFPPRHIPRGPYLFVFGLTVSPIFRKKGLGTLLVEEELSLARRIGCEKVQLIANASSRPLFSNLGFRLLAPMEELFVAHRDLMAEPVLMELPLRGPCRK